jgi:hypothetical protein
MQVGIDPSNNVDIATKQYVDSSITAAGGVTLTGTQTLTNKTLTAPVLTSPVIDSATFSTVPGSAPLFAARVWANFNGTSGSTAVRNSGNVSSVSRTATGRYTVNFTTAMNDTNYSVVGEAFTGSTGSFTMGLQVITYSTTSVALMTWNSSGASDFAYVNFAVFG